MAKHGDTGAGLARNMAAVISDAVVKMRASILPHEQRARIEATSQFMEDLEQELAPTMQRMFGQFASIEGLDPDLKAVFEEMMNPGNQSTVLLQIAGYIGAIFAIFPEMAQVTLRSSVMTLNESTRNIRLSPADAAQAVMRNIITHQDGDDAAATVGLDPLAFDHLVYMTGEPPGAVDMVNLWHQGRITEAELDTALLFSRLNDRYIPTIKKLAIEPMSEADAIEATVKGVLTVDEGIAHFVRAGGMFDEWDTLYKAAGDAIGVVEAGNLMNHGLIDQAQFDSVIARSRINPIFYDIARLQRHKFLAPYQIMQILKAGGTDAATATQWLIEDGISADQAAAFVAAGHSATTAKAKTMSESMILQEYQDQIISAQEAEFILASIGYDAASAGALVALEDAKRALSQRTTAVGATRTAYLTGRVTRQVASSELDALSIPAAARDAWLTDWDVEKATKVKEFTTAQIGTFAKEGIIDYPTAAKMWQTQGWSQPDTLILAAHYGGPAVPGSPAATPGP